MQEVIEQTGPTLGHLATEFHLEEKDLKEIIEVPGNFPYKERVKRPIEAPMTQETLCTLCGTCASVCPTAAVVVDNSVITEPERCIICHACMKNRS